MPSANPEFSRVHRTDQLGVAPEGFDHRATAGECAALARRLGLESLVDLLVAGTLRRMEDDGTVVLQARFIADVVQLCVVSLVPIERRLEVPLELVYQPANGSDAADTREVEMAFDEPDPPELLIDDAIDIGAAVVEHLALAIDPYPRQDNVLLSPQYTDLGCAAPDSHDHPLAALRSLTEKS